MRNGKVKEEYLIIGLGRFGSGVATTLHNAGQSVVAVDADAELVQHFAAILPHVVHMDSTNRDALTEIDVRHFTTAIVCIGSHLENNVLTTVLLRQLGVPRVLAKARTRTQAEILRKVGADEVVLPENDAGVHLAHRLISGRRVVDFMEVNAQISIVEIEAPKSVCGRMLKDSGIRKKHNVTVVAIRRGENVIAVPQSEEVVQPGDILVVLGRREDCEVLSMEA